MPTKTKAQLEVDIADLENKVSVLEQKNAELEQENVKLEQKNTVLEEKNQHLNEANADLHEQRRSSLSEKPEKTPWLKSALISVLILVLLAGGAQRLDRHYAKSTCGDFAAYSQHTTRFVDYNFFDWDCLVQTNGATWVSKDGLGAVEVTLPLKKN